MLTASLLIFASHQSNVLFHLGSLLQYLDVVGEWVITGFAGESEEKIALFFNFLKFVTFAKLDRTFQNLIGQIRCGTEFGTRLYFVSWRYFIWKSNSWRKYGPDFKQIYINK